LHVGRQLGVHWRFSGHTKHDHVLTPVALHHLGDAIAEQQCTKSNLVGAPEENRLMMPKVDALEERVEECCGHCSDDEEKEEGYEEEVAKVRNQHPKHCENHFHQSPLVMHRGANGGRFVHVGSVNGDGNIKKIVRALLTDSKTA
jgi:hypothetical protein